MPKVHDIQQVCQAGKDRDPGWYKIHRKLSIHITALLADTPITLNQVSLLMMAMAATGAALLTSHLLWVNALAGACLYLSFLLDKVDGEIARYRGLQSPIGILLDRFHHRLFEPLVFLALGWREYQATHSTVPLFAALATMLAANIVEEVQHLPAYIAAKHARETRAWPASEVRPAAWLRGLAAVMRSLKTFRMFITVVPLALGAILAAAILDLPVITWLLVVSAVALWVYVVFQAFYYANGGLHEQMAEHTESLPPLPPRPRNERASTAPPRTPTLSLVSSPRPPKPPAQPGPAGRTLLLVLVALGALAGRAGAATYYVDNTSLLCSNTGNGSLLQPYCTISAALAARGVAGNTFLVRSGTYAEQVTIPASGTAASPIVLQAWGGPVTVDGADDFSATSKWEFVTGNIWRAASVTWSPKQVFADGLRLTATSANTNSLPPFTFKYVSGQGLYVNVGNGNPGNHGVKVGRRNYAFVLSGKSWITIDGFTATRTEDRAINVTNGSNDVQLVNSVVSFANRYGVYVTDAVRFRIANCVVTDNAHHGIMLTTGTSQCVVEGNVSARNAVPGSRQANGLYLYASTNNVIRNNQWHDNQDTGQHLQSGANDNVSYNNVSWNNGDHGYDHLGATGTFHTNDVAYGNYKDGFSVEGGSTGTRLYNCVSADNGLTTGEYDLWVSNDSKLGFESNDNLFWNSTSQAPFRYGSGNHTLLSAYAAASGQDSRSLQLDPLFADPLGGNFHPLPGSPLIDNGNSEVANWPANDAEGNPRADDPATPDTGVGPLPFADRGALEYQVVGLVPVARLEATPAVGVAPVAVTLDASASEDGDGSIVSYEFDFGDGVSTAPQAGPIAQHTYTAGTYRAIVEVQDDAGFRSRDTVVVVANARPVAAMTATPTSGKSPLAVSFNASASTDADGGIASYHFDFGDGVVVGPQASPAASHVYGTGTWKARLLVTDNRGATDTLNTALTLTVAPPNAAPVAALALSPATGQAPLAVTADASGSSDADGGIVSYRFTFADTIVVGPQASATASATLGAGMNRVTVLVTDTDGATASRIDSVLVTLPAPDRAPVVTAPASVGVAEGGTLSLTVTAADPDGEEITALTADLGSLPPGHDAVFTPSADHTSGTLTWHPSQGHAGVWSVTFTAANALQGNAGTQIQVAETDAPPVVTGPAEILSTPGEPLAYDVVVSDPDGDGITTLTADLSALPADHPGTFTPAPGNTSGTFTWTPRAQDAGTYIVSIQAANALTGTHSTTLRIGVTDTRPEVVAAATAETIENAPFTLAVTASDPDGEAITTLTADLSGLPAGHAAAFTPTPGNQGGTLQWTPGFADSGTYLVRFIAGNGLADTAWTLVHVGNVDRAPIVTSPATVGGPAGSGLTFQVTAVDPDGDAVTSLAVDLGPLPADHTATFTLSGGAAAGTFAWTPSAAQQGTYDLSFTGSNVLAGRATTRLVVGPPNQLPVAMLAVSPDIGVAPLTVTASGAGSSDPEGGTLSYTFDFGDGNILGPQAAATASHVFVPGTWTVRLTVTDPFGAVNSVTRTVTATGSGPGPNYVANPSFEGGTSGWNSYAGAVLQRVAGGFEGLWAMQVTGGSALTSFGLNDSPNWVSSTSAAGARYRFSAWVRSETATGAVRLQVREYQGGIKVGPNTVSAPVTLTPAWQLVTVDHIAQVAGTTLDFQVYDAPVTANETFLVDHLGIHFVSASPPAAMMPGPTGDALTAGGALAFGARVSPAVVRADATLHFTTTQPGPVRADLFDTSGRRVRALMDAAYVAAGQHSVAIDGRSDRGERLESGVYFYRLQAAERTAVGKLVVAR